MHLSTMTETGQFDTQRATLVLTDSAVQDRLVDQVQQTLRRRGYAGLDVDFEYIRPELGAAYAAFVDRLRRELNPLGCSVLVALAPKTFAGQRGLLYEAHDYTALGRAANGVLLMTYEWGYTAGPPMAVAPLDKVRQVVDYALTEIPAEKLFLGRAGIWLRLAAALPGGGDQGGIRLAAGGPGPGPAARGRDTL